MKVKRNSGKILLLFGIYCVLVIWIILFKMSRISEIGNLVHPRKINLIPFHHGEAMAFLISDVIRNVLIFLPVGIYLKMLKVPNGNAVLFGAGFSMTLEILQFLLVIGEPDITDVITNTSGTLIGVCVYLLLIVIFRQYEKLDRLLTILASICTVLLLVFIATLFAVN